MVLGHLILHVVAAFVVGVGVEEFVDYFRAYLEIVRLIQEDSFVSLAVPVWISGIGTKSLGD